MNLRRFYSVPRCGRPRVCKPEINRTEGIMATYFRNRVAVLGVALMLGGALGGCANDRPASAVMDDTAITTKVKSAFATDKDVSAMAVHVQTTNGRVHLTG